MATLGSPHPLFFKKVSFMDFILSSRIQELSSMQVSSEDNQIIFTCVSCRIISLIMLSVSHTCKFILPFGLLLTSDTLLFVTSNMVWVVVILFFQEAFTVKKRPGGIFSSCYREWQYRMCRSAHTEELIIFYEEPIFRLIELVYAKQICTAKRTNFFKCLK